MMNILIAVTCNGRKFSNEIYKLNRVLEGRTRPKTCSNNAQGFTIDDVDSISTDFSLFKYLR